MRTAWLLPLLLLGSVSPAPAMPSLVESVADGVTIVRDDAGNWGGMTYGITHMNRGEYTARKLLDASDVPAAVWEAASEVRLSVYFMVHDYSWHDLPQTNGLDEAYEISINGTAHRFPTNHGAPVYWEGKPPAMAWYDFVIDRAELRRGPNEIQIHKAADAKGDDYLYLGIDNTLRRGNSAVTFDGQNWTQDRLTVPGGNGEYMVRLVLLQTDLRFMVHYAPGRQPAVEDPANLLRYVGARGASPTDGGLALQPGQVLRLEWQPEQLDTLAPLAAAATVTGTAEMAWLDADDLPTGQTTGAGALALSAPGSLRPAGLVVRAVQGPVTVAEVTLSGRRSYHPRQSPVDLCPRMAPPACGSRLPAGRPSCRRTDRGVTLDNGLLQARFETGERLRLVSLANAITCTEMVRQPEALWLFWVQVGDRAYAGSRDFEVVSLALEKRGFTAELALREPALRASLRARIESEGLRLGLTLTNAGPAPVDFKLSFPHLAGLGVSDQPAGDYFFFPAGGGIINDQPALIRRGYGDYEALYQVLDLYSPAKGGGVYLRLDDSEGWHKILSLRKVVPGKGEVWETALRANDGVREEFRSPNPLDAVPGTSLSADYLRRTRPAGGSFAPADAILGAHADDWHAAVRSYADWAHRVWTWRRYPSRLQSVRNLMPTGWGQDILFRDGRYRTDFIRPPQAGVPGPTPTNCIELMSWWEWSPLGPFMTPLDKLAERCDPPTYERYWKPYLVKDPVTGQLMWNNQPGDYSGYNERFGGLPPFRQAVQTYQRLGALVTLYTDPYRLDENCPTGKAHGREWCVVGPDGKLATGYEVFNPCYQVPAARQWAAATMERVLRETGADGIRLDEVGHAGWACYSPDHEHTYQEPGISQWQKAATEMVRLVRAGMDRVRPGLVLTTEFPAYDYMMPHLEGAITYDLSLQASPLRPIECNLQRFHFPECKPYELDHRGRDPLLRKVFWNGGESFERYFPLPYYTILNENEPAYQGRDCTPLLWTPGQAPGIYVNRFAAGDTTLYHVYNASGFTYDGVVLAVPVTPEQHLFDLLGYAEVKPVRLPEEDLAGAPLYLARNDVGCIARLPRRVLQVDRQGQALTVRVGRLPRPSSLALADRDGRLLLVQPARRGSNTLSLDRLQVMGRPACIKLLAGRTLVDAVGIPAE
jgi:hypothetical protein